jgi:hypothetical protein
MAFSNHRSYKEIEEDRRRSVDFEDDEEEEEDSRSGSYRNDDAFRKAWKASAERTPSPNYD